MGQEGLISKQKLKKKQIRPSARWISNYKPNNCFHNPSRPDPRQREKINLNFQFHTSLPCLRRFDEVLNGLHKTFWGTINVKKNIKFILILIQLLEMHGTGRVNLSTFHQKKVIRLVRENASRKPTVSIRLVLTIWFSAKYLRLIRFNILLRFGPVKFAYMIKSSAKATSPMQSLVGLKLENYNKI